MAKLWFGCFEYYHAYRSGNTFNECLCVVLVYLFGVLHRFQHCTGHITTGSWKGRLNQYIQFVRVLYCKLPINGKQLPAFPLEAVLGIEPRPQRWEVRVLHSATVAPMCGVGAKSVAHLMKFHLLQSEVVKVKTLMNSNMTLTVLNLHQKTDPKVQQDFEGQGHYKVKGQIKVTS